MRPPRIFSGAISQLRFCSRKEYLVNEDISNGRENNKLPAVSYKRNDKAPKDYHYVTNYIQYEPLSVDVSIQNMASCKCSDDCTDGGCYCSSGHKSGRSYDSRGRLAPEYNVDAPEVLYECNAACKCNRKNCKNMVIQAGPKCKLTLFRTKSRGWGVRTMETLDRGTFVGVYSGELISAASSQKRHDDTYLFNLATTHIYHQQIEQPAEAVASKPDDDNVGPEVGSNWRAEDSSLMTDDQQQHHQQKQQVEVDAESTDPEQQQPQVCTTQVEEITQSVEQFVCDAKFYGNVTRFINHSCEANVIGIRSFTEHQDSRFPLIAFFTNGQIPANTELTLNYGDNYWLVKCKRDNVFCLCKKPSCRFSRKTFPETLRQHNKQRQKQTGNSSRSNQFVY